MSAATSQIVTDPALVGLAFTELLESARQVRHLSTRVGELELETEKAKKAQQVLEGIVEEQQKALNQLRQDHLNLLSKTEQQQVVQKDQESRLETLAEQIESLEHACTSGEGHSEQVRSEMNGVWEATSAALKGIEEKLEECRSQHGTDLKNVQKAVLSALFNAVAQHVAQEAAPSTPPATQSTSSRQKDSCEKQVEAREEDNGADLMPREVVTVKQGLVSSTSSAQPTASEEMQDSLPYESQMLAGSDVVLHQARNQAASTTISPKLIETLNLDDSRGQKQDVCTQLKDLIIPRNRASADTQIQLVSRTIERSTFPPGSSAGSSDKSDHQKAKSHEAGKTAVSRTIKKESTDDPLRVAQDTNPTVSPQPEAAEATQSAGVSRIESITRSRGGTRGSTEAVQPMDKEGQPLAAKHGDSRSSRDAENGTASDSTSVGKESNAHLRVTEKAKAPGIPVASPSDGDLHSKALDKSQSAHSFLYDIAWRQNIYAFRTMFMGPYYALIRFHDIRASEIPVVIVNDPRFPYSFISQSLADTLVERGEARRIQSQEFGDGSIETEIYWSYNSVGRTPEAQTFHKRDRGCFLTSRVRLMVVSVRQMADGAVLGTDTLCKYQLKIRGNTPRQTSILTSEYRPGLAINLKTFPVTEITRPAQDQYLFLRNLAEYAASKHNGNKSSSDLVKRKSEALLTGSVTKKRNVSNTSNGITLDPRRSVASFVPPSNSASGGTKLRSDPSSSLQLDVRNIREQPRSGSQSRQIETIKGVASDRSIRGAALEDNLDSGSPLSPTPAHWDGESVDQLPRTFEELPLAQRIECVNRTMTALEMQRNQGVASFNRNGQEANSSSASQRGSSTGSIGSDVPLAQRLNLPGHG